MDGRSGYTAPEVVYLLSLSRADALDADARFRDSCASLRQRDLEGDAPTSHEEWDPVFVIARWWDVRRARERVVTDKLERAVVELRVQGVTEQQVAELVGLTRSTARRRFRATLKEILRELGGEDPLDRVSVLSACLSCAAAPRARLRAVRTRRGWRAAPERQSSLCANCLPADARPWLVSA